MLTYGMIHTCRPWVGMLALLLSLNGMALHGEGLKQDKPPLQQRVEALSQAISLRFNNRPQQFEAANDRLAATLASWNQLAEPTAADRQELHDWLSYSLRLTMGRRGAGLPSSLVFNSPVLLPASSLAGSASAKAILAGPVSLGERRTSASPAEKSVKRTVAKPVQSRQNRSRWSQHPSSAPLKWEDPFHGKSAQRGASKVGGPSQGEGSRQHYEARKPVRAGVASVTVNHAELIAAIRGYNLALQQVNRKLQRVEHFGVDRLLLVAADLERLQDERDFLSLYMGSLSSDSRRLLPSPMPASLTYELVLRQSKKLLVSSVSESSSDRSLLQELNRQLGQYQAVQYK